MAVRVLYVCYLSLDDPLVETQAIAYLAGLAELGHAIHLLTFETNRRDRSARRTLRARLAAQGIAWHGMRYHKRPTVLATACDVLLGSAYVVWLVRRYGLNAVHARNHVPAAMALIARRFHDFRLIFDVRGLMAEEYEDAGRWRRGSIPFRLTKAVERRTLQKADATVVLTRRVRDHLCAAAARMNIHVIPCCADVETIEAAHGRRAETRQRLNLDDGTVLVYVGKFTGWYMEREMADFFAILRELQPNTRLLVLTQSDPGPIQRELARNGIDRSAWTITSCPPSELGTYLAGADAGIAFIRPTFSKISSSPTKVGEYLAAGLPMVVTSGVGDVDELVNQYRVGVPLARWDRTALRQGAEKLIELLADAELAQRARRAARERLSLTGIGIPAYAALYRDLRASGLTVSGRSQAYVARTNQPRR